MVYFLGTAKYSSDMIRFLQNVIPILKYLYFSTCIVGTVFCRYCMELYVYCVRCTVYCVRCTVNYTIATLQYTRTLHYTTGLIQ